jgi:sensor histidine kinase YesM
MPLISVSRLRALALVFVAWMSFFALLPALSAALSPDHRYELTPVELVGAVLWTALTLVIFWYHRWLRGHVSHLAVLAIAYVPLLVVASASDAMSTAWAMRQFTHAESRIGIAGLIVFYLDFDLVAFAVTVAIAEVLIVRRAVLDREAQAARLERSLARARLDYLEAQLQPHFLFNSLGAVSELAYDAPATATRVLRQLASIFRTALGTKTDEITLGEEIVGVEPYLDIQRIRFADWLTIEYHVDDFAVDCLVPRFILQPLIENAIRHGLSGRHAAGTIEISASVNGSVLSLRVADNGVGLDGSSSSTGRGIGLSNVRDRLRILYGTDDGLRLSSDAAGGAVAELSIPARRREAVVAELTSDPGDANSAEEVRTLSMPKILRRRGLALVLLWLVSGLVWTQQSYLYLLVRGRLDGATWWSIFRADMTSALIWASLTPIVLHFARLLPLRRKGWEWRAMAYAVFATLIVVVHAVLWQRVSAPGTSPFSPQYQMSMVVGFLIVCVLATVAHRDQLRGWLRDRENAAAALSAEVHQARERAEKLQRIPPVLLGSLESIAESARRDPDLTERQLTRLADYVRLALECSDERGITPEREIALAEAFEELEATGAYSLTLSA